ncbi:MAG: NAD(P)H-hydrate dehydratase [Coriobacteriales bacterium]|nr:NAD(P)H-hydrate dehydratase [Coriobacteriales bacterium]
MRLPDLPLDANKYSRGSLLVLGGSGRFPGAAILAARAATLTGAGYVTLAVPESVVPVAQSHLLSIPVIAAPEAEGAFAAGALSTVLAQLHHLDAIVLGPGLTAAPSVTRFVGSVLRNTHCPLLVDADALNVLAVLLKPHVPLAGLAGRAVLTPHAGELRRLLDATGASSAAGLAELLDVTVVAKGPTTEVTNSETSRICDEGTPALAKAGTGDVLSGIIGSLLAQGIVPFDAAHLGVVVHARCGCFAQDALGIRSVTAESLLDHLPVALRDTIE